jgi:hypothetical protein
VQSHRTHTDLKRQAGSQSFERKNRGSLTLNVTLHTFTSLTLSTMTTRLLFFLLFYIFIYIYLYATCVYVHSFRFTRLCASLFLSYYSESFIGKRDSPANGRLIKQNSIILVTAIEKKTRTHNILRGYKNFILFK